MSEQLPIRIGPYLIEEKVGAGGMGTVYRGRHESSGELAAVKVLPASLAREEGLVARFAREIDALKQLSNPHIVNLLDSGVDGDTYYYAMEYVDGETIAQRLRRDKRIPWPEVVEMALQICVALKAAHDTGIVHRDLKPSNLMVTSNGTVKLADFGIAQVFAANRLTITGGIVGTAEFMSPEQAQGTRATRKSDLYSLGAVMYVMLTGRPPFSGKTTVDVIQKQRFGRFDRPSLIVDDIPHWLEEIVCQLLEKEPDKRFPDAYVLSRRLVQELNKMQLSREQATSADPSYDGFAPTVTANGPGRAEAAGPAGPGAGTLMRDLMRIEIERAAHQKSAVGRLLDSTPVLLLLLVLLIGGGVYWFQPPALSDAERFAAGVKLLEAPEGPDWFKAREEFFQPLVDANPDAWEQKAEPYLKRIEEYELRRKLQPRQLLGRKPQPDSEAERLFLLARHYGEMGDNARAERILTSLISLLAGDGEREKLYHLAQEMLQELQTDRPQDSDRDALLTAALQRADALAAEGKTEEARTIWTSIIDLYAIHPGAAEFVEQARLAIHKQGIGSRE